MKDIRPALRAFLLGDPLINAAIKTDDTHFRIFPIRLPQGEIRASIVYNRITGMGDNKMDGRTGLSRPRFQIDCWAQSADAANSLANLVKDRIDGFRGQWAYGSNSPQDYVFIQGVFYESERDAYDEDSNLYSLSRDYFIWNEEL